jgi:hypothetical protein
MASNVMLQLADGEGLMSVVIFSGLLHPMIMHPAIYGEPALTAQAFYYLEEIGAAAQLHFEDGQKQLSNEAIDQGHTPSLALDALNDPHVSHIEPVDPSDRIDLTDWNIGVNYVMDRFEPYVHDVGAVISKRIKTLVAPSSDRDGYFGRLRVLKPDRGLIDYWQASGLSNIRLRSIPATTTTAVRDSLRRHSLQEDPARASKFDL